MNNIHDEIEIVPAAPGDAEAVLALWREAADWIQAKGIDQWRASQFSREEVQKYVESAELFVAKYGGIVVGTAILQWSDKFIWEELDNDQSGYVHKLAVKRDYGGRGIGGLMLRWAGSYAGECGKRLLRLDCMADNVRLNNYYQRHGFAFVRRWDFKTWSANLYEKVIDIAARGDTVEGKTN